MKRFPALLGYNWITGDWIDGFSLVWTRFEDFSKPNKLKIAHWINETAAQGETVVLHCNGSEDSGVDFVWRKEKNIIFIYSPYINRTVTNYTSSRMSVDPSDPRKLQISNVQPSDAGNYYCFPSRILWILAIKVRAGEPERFIDLHMYIIPSVTGAVAIFFIIFGTVWIQRRCKRN